MQLHEHPRPTSVRARSIADTDTQGRFVVIDTVGLSDDFMAEINQHINRFTAGLLAPDTCYVAASAALPQ